jgi:hypothetical protein
MAKDDQSEKMGITDMVEFLEAHMEFTEQVDDLKERIEERSKLKLQNLVEIEAYLEQKKKRKTAQEKIDYLYNMDPNFFDEELVQLGIESMGDVQAVCDTLRRMEDIAGSFATNVKESGVLDRLTISLPAAANALKINPTLMGTNIPTADYQRLVSQVKNLQPHVQQVNQIFDAFATLPSLSSANQLVQQMNVISNPVAEIQRQLEASMQLPIDQITQISRAANQFVQQMNVISNPVAEIQRQLEASMQLPINQITQISRGLEQVNRIAQSLSVALAPIQAEQMSAIQKSFAPIVQSAEQMSAIQKSFAPIVQSGQMSAIQKLFESIKAQIEPLKPFFEAFVRICGSRKSHVYHRLVCPYVRRIERENLIIFDSAKEAKKGGYSPCKLCRPL